jgi:hypothetical protein
MMLRDTSSVMMEPDCPYIEASQNPLPQVKFKTSPRGNSTLRSTLKRPQLDSIKGYDPVSKLTLYDYDELSRGNLLPFFNKDTLDTT